MYMYVHVNQHTYIWRCKSTHVLYIQYMCLQASNQPPTCNTYICVRYTMPFLLWGLYQHLLFTHMHQVLCIHTYVYPLTI